MEVHVVLWKLCFWRLVAMNIYQLFVQLGIPAVLILQESFYLRSLKTWGNCSAGTNGGNRVPESPTETTPQHIWKSANIHLGYRGKATQVASAMPLRSWICPWSKRGLFSVLEHFNCQQKRGTSTIMLTSRSVREGFPYVLWVDHILKSNRLRHDSFRKAQVWDYVTPK